MNALNNFQRMTPYTVGFDRIFDQMTKLLDHSTAPTNGYPPYNLSKEGNFYYIDLAVAGVAKEDIVIEVEDNILKISYDPYSKDSEPSHKERDWIFKGIAQRAFTRSFTVAENIVVHSANMSNGMLQIVLEQLVPETKKPKKIAIS